MHWSLRVPRKIVGITFLATLSLAASAAQASASVTIGQVVQAPEGCAPNNDWAQLSVGSGPSYVAPGNGSITSWSHPAGAGAGQTMTMKIWRQVVAGTTYKAVGHDGPRALAPNALNTFATSIPVQPGDVLGFHTGAVPPAACLSGLTPGDTLLGRLGDAADGAPADFGPYARHLNITAVFTPSNTFTFADIARNKKKGTATLTVDLPNAGVLTASGKGAKVSGPTAIGTTLPGPGAVTLTIKAKGRARRKLKETGKAKLNLTVTYTPTGGDPGTQSLKIRLKKR